MRHWQAAFSVDETISKYAGGTMAQVGKSGIHIYCNPSQRGIQSVSTITTSRRSHITQYPNPKNCLALLCLCELDYWGGTLFGRGGYWSLVLRLPVADGKI